MLSKIVAHRGFSHLAPENTLEAFRHSQTLGNYAIEFDVRISQDHQVYVFHDDFVDRTTNSSGYFSLLKSSEIELLDAGAWFKQNYAACRIPKFSEVIIWMNNHKVRANIEIKTSFENAQDTAASVVKDLDKYWQGSLPLISSFSYESLLACRRINRDLPLALLLKSWDPLWQKKAETLDAVALHLNYKDLNHVRSSAIKKAGYLLGAYTVNEVLRAQQLFAFGVDWIFSDYNMQI
jgi:glycerophosphoryl diester phosphodiesterase